MKSIVCFQNSFKPLSAIKLFLLISCLSLIESLNNWGMLSFWAEVATRCSGFFILLFSEEVRQCIWLCIVAITEGKSRRRVFNPEGLCNRKSMKRWRDKRMTLSAFPSKLASPPVLLISVLILLSYPRQNPRVILNIASSSDLSSNQSPSQANSTFWRGLIVVKPLYIPTLLAETTPPLTHVIA